MARGSNYSTFVIGTVVAIFILMVAASYLTGLRTPLTPYLERLFG